MAMLISRSGGTYLIVVKCLIIPTVFEELLVSRASVAVTFVRAVGQKLARKIRCGQNANFSDPDIPDTASVSANMAPLQKKGARPGSASHPSGIRTIFI